jgi:amidase
MAVEGTDTKLATELWRMSALELAAGITSGHVSSREVIEAHLRRIEEVNPSVNALTVVVAEEALDAADRADRAVADGSDLPSLHGVPFTVKENIDLAGTATTNGLKMLAETYPDRDAPVVERMRAAGAIPIGHTNCPNITVRWHTDSELWGATVNPWDPSRTPGASSGGEAAALATGMSPLGLGNDGLGSLRWPAYCCGVAALKPSLGRVPHASAVEPGDAPIGIQLTAVQGPMARRIGDLRTALHVIAGPTWRDPWSVPAPLDGLAPSHPIRVAVVVDPAGLGTVRQVRESVQNAARALDDAGYAVAEAEPPSVDLAAHALLDMLGTPEIRATWESMAPILPDDTRRFMTAFYEVVGDRGPVAALSSFVTRQALLRAWGEFQEDFSLIVAPTYTDIPFEVGADLTVSAVAETIRGMRMTLAVNALGLPAVAVPVGVEDGLPQGVQIIGARYREDLCLDAAQALEDEFGIFTPIDPR